MDLTGLHLCYGHATSLAVQAAQNLDSEAANCKDSHVRHMH